MPRKRRKINPWNQSDESVLIFHLRKYVEGTDLMPADVLRQVYDDIYTKRGRYTLDDVYDEAAAATGFDLRIYLAPITQPLTRLSIKTKERFFRMVSYYSGGKYSHTAGRRIVKDTVAKYMREQRETASMIVKPNVAIKKTILEFNEKFDGKIYQPAAMAEDGEPRITYL